MDWNNKDGFLHVKKAKEATVTPNQKTAWENLSWHGAISMLIWQIERQQPSRCSKLGDVLFSLKQAKKYIEEMDSYPKGFVSRYAKKSQ